jgi:hypothetical protein
MELMEGALSLVAEVVVLSPATVKMVAASVTVLFQAVLSSNWSKADLVVLPLVVEHAKALYVWAVVAMLAVVVLLGASPKRELGWTLCWALVAEIR